MPSPTANLHDQASDLCIGPSLPEVAAVYCLLPTNNCAVVQYVNFMHDARLGSSLASLKDVSSRQTSSGATVLHDELFWIDKK